MAQTEGASAKVEKGKMSERNEIPLERLELETMASGDKSLRLTDRVPWEAFPMYAESVIASLGGTIVGRADGPDERVWTAIIKDCEFWISFDELVFGVSLEAKNAEASRLIPDIRRTLLALRDSKKIILRLEHSVDVDACPAFVWNFRTNISNWNDPPATFALNGAFAPGSRGTTHVPGQEPRYWLIREVRPEQSFLIETPLDRATLTFEWLFEPLSGTRTKMTQCILLSGENAAAYAGQVEHGFGQTLPQGMKRIAEEIAAAEKSRDGR
jgi:hypothetical protein